MADRRNKVETIIAYVVQSLIVTAIISVVGVGINSRINTAAIDSIRVMLEGFQKSIQELAKMQQETALINATQTQQLIFMNDALRECKVELRGLKSEKEN